MLFDQVRSAQKIRATRGNLLLGQGERQCGSGMKYLADCGPRAGGSQLEIELVLEQASEFTGKSNNHSGFDGADTGIALRHLT